MSHSSRAARALAHLAERDPALSVLALWCAHRDGDLTETNGARITYGPEFAALSLAEQIGLVGHHVMHVALRHSARRQAMADRFGSGFHADLFGLAADALVNETLLMAKHGLPRPAVTVTELLQAAGLAAETPVGALAAWDVERLYMKLAGDPERAARARTHGETKGWQPDLADGARNAGAEDPEADPSEWQARLSRALQAGQRAGTGIGSIGATLADFAAPRISWERQLRRLVLRALRHDPRPVWRRPAGRWAAMEAHARATGGAVPVFQPYLRQLQERARVIIALDVSTSIDRPTLKRFAGEIGGILRRGDAEARLLAFDTEVHLDIAVSPENWQAQIASAALPQGGGTDFAPVLAHAARYRPSIAVILTDLEGPCGPRPPFPTLWATPGGNAQAPFGSTLSLDGA